MSSRKLLALLEHLPEDTAFKKAHREGDWSFDEYVSAGIVNELRLLRTDQAAINGQKMETILIESPAQLEKKNEAALINQAHRAGILAQLYGQDLGEKANDAS